MLRAVLARGEWLEAALAACCVVDAAPPTLSLTARGRVARAVALRGRAAGSQRTPTPGTESCFWGSRAALAKNASSDFRPVAGTGATHCACPRQGSSSLPCPSLQPSRVKPRFPLLWLALPGRVRETHSMRSALGECDSATGVRAGDWRDSSASKGGALKNALPRMGVAGCVAQRHR